MFGLNHSIYIKYENISNESSWHVFIKKASNPFVNMSDIKKKQLAERART